jgi:gluconokinase
MEPEQAGEPFVLALDIGSSSTRTIPYDREANALTDAAATRSYTVRVSRTGAAELAGDELVEKAAQCVEETLSRLGRRATSLRGVSMSVFMHSPLGVDAQGDPTTPVIMWSDTRSVAEVEEVRRAFGGRIHAVSGCPPHTSYAPAKFLWLRRHQPDVVERTHLWLSMGDFVLYRFFGRASSSRSLASSLGLLDVESGEWSREILDFLEWDRARLAPLAAHDDGCTGPVSPWRERLGIAGRVPWFPANADGACSNVGSGASTAETYALNLGTSGAIRVLDRTLPRRAPRGLWCYLTNDNRPYVGGAISNAGNLFAWLCERFRLTPTPDLDKALGRMEPDAHGLTMLPFLMGERSVGWAGQATAAVAGLRASTTETEVLRAALETVGIRLALILQRLRPVSPATGKVVGGGGFLRSPAWVRIVTDALGVPLYESGELEASARGAAIFALYAMGEIGDVSDIPGRLGEAHEPDPRATERYAAATERHLALYRSLVGDPG